MRRLTEMIAYLESTTEDWQKTNGISYYDFHSFNITPGAKEMRKAIQYNKGKYKDLL